MLWDKEPPQDILTPHAVIVGVSQWGEVYERHACDATAAGIENVEVKSSKKSLETGEIEVYIKSSLDFDSYFDFLILT